MADLKFFGSMDKVNRAIQLNDDPEQMMSDVLDVVLSIFQRDRAWLGYPCDPDAATWRAPMERTRPEYLGALALGIEVPMDKDGAEAIDICRAAKESGKTFDVAILDLTVPGGMGGKETVKGLLATDPEAKAIVSSGYSDDPVPANFEAYGFKGKIPKPFGSQSWSEVLHDVLNV